MRGILLLVTLLAMLSLPTVAADNGQESDPPCVAASPSHVSVNERACQRAAMGAIQYAKRLAPLGADDVEDALRAFGL